MTNVLYVEPDKILAEIYYEALTREGYNVVATPSAQTALMVTDEFKPDLIILELQLIEHSGIEFLYELRSYLDWQNIPVIIQTQVLPSAFQDNHNVLKKQLNVARYLYKPKTSLKALVQTIKEVSEESLALSS